MTRPPEYDKVALWLRALTGDPALVEEIKSSYPGSAPALDAGLTGEEFAEQECQRLAGEARHELFSVSFAGIDLEIQNLDQIAEAYHRDQVTEYSREQRGLQEEIRRLDDGDFEVPPSCLDRAEREGTDLGLVIEEHRLGALFDARASLAALPGAYRVTEDEAQAHQAARHQAAARHLIEQHHAEPGLVASDVPTLRFLGGIHYAAHESLDRGPGMGDDPHDSRYHAPWGQLVMQAQADDWWARRDRLYTRRPEVLNEIREREEEIRRNRDEDSRRENRLDEQIEQGDASAQEALNAELTRQALETDLPKPSAREDPAEWEAFFRDVLGRDMPANAAYEAENYRIGAAAPPDVGGMAATYYEANYPRGYDYGALSEEREGLSWEQLHHKRYTELQASEGFAHLFERSTADPASLAAAAQPGESERDQLIKEAAERFPEYSYPDLQQAAIDADARANWNGFAYPPYEGPGYTEPPANWQGWHTDHSQRFREHYWDPGSDHAALAAAHLAGREDIPEAPTEDSSPPAGLAPGPPRTRHSETTAGHAQGTADSSGTVSDTAQGAGGPPVHPSADFPGPWTPGTEGRRARPRAVGESSLRAAGRTL